jgi:hypothetical protein
MRENTPQGYTTEKVSRCEINHLFGGSPCTKAARENVDGLALCERHALEAKLEGQIKCWEEILFHIDLWSGRQHTETAKISCGSLRFSESRQRLPGTEPVRIWTRSEGGAECPGKEESPPYDERLSPPSSKRRPAALPRASTSST